MPTAKPAAKVQRRLAAIFCADVAGYTRLMNADERGTLRMLTAHREITDRQIAAHGGRIANTAGDSILAEFPSAVDAIEGALDIQERIAVFNTEVPEAHRISFRIGVHVGEAMVRDGDLFGDGVNVAARMQGLAEPGSVCLSATAHEYVHRVLPLRFEDLGPQHVKNIDTPIRAFLVRPARQQASAPIPQVHRRLEIYLARRFYSACRGAVEAVLPDGITSVEPPVLNALNDAPGLDEARLSARLGFERPRLRAILRKLERLKLVRRTKAAKPGGAPVFHLTPAGREAHQRFRPAIIAALDRLMSVLSDHERDQLQVLLARVIQADEMKEQLAAEPAKAGAAKS
jgi:adenylate cyclase